MSRSFSVTAKKSLSQNFLIDEAVLSAIVACINPQNTDYLIEIGPGTGALTSRLYNRVDHLQLIELDDRLIPKLREHFPRAKLHHLDVLQLDFASLMTRLPPNAELRLVGNLPYQISTPLLFHVLESSAPIQDLTFLLQKEVVDRLVALPSHADYGRLSVMIQAYFHTEKLLAVAPQAFHPAPKVDSALVRLIPRQDRPTAEVYPYLIQVTQAAFNQRRKTLRNSLNAWKDSDLLADCAIDPKLRAENLSISDYLQLARYLLIHNIQSNPT